MIKKNTLIIILSIIVLIAGASLVVFESGSLDSKKEKEANKTEVTNKEEGSTKDDSNEGDNVVPPSQEESDLVPEKEPVKENNDNKDNDSDNDSELTPEKDPIIEIPDNSTIINKKITVDNRCNITAQAFEKIYEDNKYTYYLSTISSGCIYVKVDGKEYTLKKAISENIVTVYELEANGFKFIKEDRNVVTR